MVLLVVGLLAGLFLPATNTMLDNNRRNETRTKLEALEVAMTRFVMTNRRLPCPANGSLAPGNANQGLAQPPVGVCDPLALTNGVVPWRTLGIAQTDAMDAWGNLVTYRVWGGVGVGANQLTLPNGMDMSALDPGNGTVVIDWLATRGFRACNGLPCDAGDAAELASKANGNGVAYFLISHGANKVDGFNPSGTLALVNGPGPGAREIVNRNNQAPRTTIPNGDFYIDTDIDPNEATYYDDIVLRPTVLKVALDAGLGPRVTP